MTFPARDANSPTAGPAYADLDAASSEPMHPAAREVLMSAIDQGYADPRRLHHGARTARLLLDNAREVVASSLGVRTGEVTFTSSGTDAVHRGLLGLMRGRERAGHTLVHSAVEHSAVLHAARWAQAPTLAVRVTTHGLITPEAVQEALSAGDEPVGVLAVQHANHEVGTVQPVAEIAAATDIPMFVDACASTGRLPLPDGWAVAAASAHKWGGPAGVGVLLVRTGARWRNAFPADDRVDERSSGFENVPAALAAAAALQAVVEESAERGAREFAMVERIRHAVARLPDVEVVGDPVLRLPHLVTFSCLYVDGEALVHELDRRGFGVASGSACTASTLEPSHVLAAMGVLTHGNVRLAVGRSTTDDDVSAFLAALPDVVTELRARVGL
ncbi:aminotransferase class V-fold PLP-dependent enzyme [Nocardioides sp. InS609-2]|uniref:cysteine desulfurase family protein n=1 Tax=Nocardioides sp. InS609-2 TaxID=2760705 RepID=UPI0020C07953|nr:aminotransferase class V-fold PLP-dependent enzyme [Nocardioides sp. InS609-2]